MSFVFWNVFLDSWGYLRCFGGLLGSFVIFGVLAVLEALGVLFGVLFGVFEGL